MNGVVIGVLLLVVLVVVAGEVDWNVTAIALHESEPATEGGSIVGPTSAMTAPPAPRCTLHERCGAIGARLGTRSLLGELSHHHLSERSKNCS